MTFLIMVLFLNAAPKDIDDITSASIGIFNKNQKFPEQKNKQPEIKITESKKPSTAIENKSAPAKVDATTSATPEITAKTKKIQYKPETQEEKKTEKPVIAKKTGIDATTSATEAVIIEKPKTIQQKPKIDQTQKFPENKENIVQIEKDNDKIVKSQMMETKEKPIEKKIEIEKKPETVTEKAKENKSETVEKKVETENKDIVKQQEKKKFEIEKKAEIVVKKPEEEKITTEIIDNYIVLQSEDNSGRESFDNTKRPTKMIIFENSNDTIPPSLSFEVEEKKKDEIRDYEREDYIPRTNNEFIKAKPPYSFDNNNVLKKGNIILYDVIGETFFREAFNLYQKGELKLALNYFSKLFYYNYRSAESSYYIGLCLYLEKNKIISINYLKNAVILSEGENLPAESISVFYYQIASIYNDLGEFNTAISYYTNSLGKNNKNTANFNGIGISYYKLGNIENALSSWKKGMEAGNKDCESNYKWLAAKQ